MAKNKNAAAAGIVLPTRKMTPEQLAEQMHFARRAGAINGKRSGISARGGRQGAKRMAVSSGW